MPSPARAQASPPPEPAATQLDPVVVTATRHAERSFDVPASVSSIDGATIRDGQPAINLSEPLVRVPGIFAANRNNYAQDLQISSRGFGSRATFGVRGVRLYQDFIPATMPDGQGQTGSFSLLSAKSIEVLRGPFSTLYGNASGGVIAVFTEDPTLTPVLDFAASVGSFTTYNVGLKATGTAAGVGYVIAGNHFETDGYRAHSSASRDLVNAKLVFNPGERTTRHGDRQFAAPAGFAGPAGPDASAGRCRSAAGRSGHRAFRYAQDGQSAARRRGASSTRSRNATTLRVTGYGGRRQIGQYLALEGAGPTSSGGVVNLDRDFGGLGARLIVRGELAGRPVLYSVGADGDRMRETRQGFVNNSGAQGALRRDEDNTVTSGDVYAQMEWHALPAWSFTLGVRSSRVAYDSVDHYIVGPNPDDSGERTYTNTSPIAAVVWHARDNLNVYASYGQGFETPTFAELAYRPVGPGLNLALDPATSSSVELGVKWLPSPRQRLNLAVFAADTSQEIVVNAATGGRTTYRNASDTRRRGFEAEWDGDLGAGFTAHVNYTWLEAEFEDGYLSGVPPVAVPAGARLPGVPPQQAYGVLNWTPGGFFGFNAALEVQYVGKIYANDRNTAYAPAYTIGNARVGFAQVVGNVKFSEYVRVNNFTDESYIGSVIVGDTNGRFFEPAPGRNWFAGVSVNVAF